MPVLPPLPLCPGQVPRGEAAAGRGGTGPQLCLLVPLDVGGPRCCLAAARPGAGVTDVTVEPSAVATDPLLSVEDLHVSFGHGNLTVQAVAGISFAQRP